MAAENHRRGREGRASASPPAYARLRDLLRGAIEHGEYEDKRVPTDLELTKRFGVSRHTVRQAMNELAAEGLIKRIPGRGTFATGAHNAKYVRAFGNVSDIMAFATDTTLRVIEPLHAVRNEQIARRLGEQGDEVETMVVTRLRHGQPMGVAEVYITREMASLVPPLSTAVDHHVAIIQLLERAVGEPIVDADQEITAASAAGPAAWHLSVPEGTPLLRIERLYHLPDGRPMELAISHYRPDRYSYRMSLRGRTTR